MIASRAADAAYGVRRGTCRALWEAGLIRGQCRLSRGRRGYTLMLSLADLDRHWMETAR